MMVILSGLCWTAAYIEIIRLGFKDKTCGMPVFALGLNVSWELIATLNSFTNPAGVDAQGYVNLVWLLLDVVIVATYIRYGRRSFPPEHGTLAFIAWSLLILLSGLMINYAFIFELNEIIGVFTGAGIGEDYAAFLINLLLSVLFIDMFFRRGGMEGQSIAAGVFRGVGTMIAVWVYAPGHPLMLWPGILCAVFDAIYVGLLVSATVQSRPTAYRRAGSGR